MHSPSARALSHPQPLLHCPHALNPIMHTKLVYKHHLVAMVSHITRV